MLLTHIQELSSHIGTVATILGREDLGRGSSATHTTNINANMQTPFQSLNNIYMYTLNLRKVSGKQTKKITRWLFLSQGVQTEKRWRGTQDNIRCYVLGQGAYREQQGSPSFVTDINSNESKATIKTSSMSRICSVLKTKFYIQFSARCQIDSITFPSAGAQA